MNLQNFGPRELQNGTLDRMLEQVGIDDVSSFVNKFRNTVEKDVDQKQQQDEDMTVRNAGPGQKSGPDWMSMGTSLFKQFAGGKGQQQQSSGSSGGAADYLESAQKAYNMFSGKGGSSGSSSGGGLLDSIGDTYKNVQQMHQLYKSFDKNGDGKVTAEDLQMILTQIGLGSVSPYLAKGLFKAVDTNHNGELDFTDLMALTSILQKLSGQFGGGGRGAAAAGGGDEDLAEE
ncbi:unnamed protein product [Didymodactylos carnosus]|uniref:EF-hand domain-containing protein n=1 Tax=Didymodactylos carnosus TaxID=1234261 RepID=A0A814D446_9BILA|nr:unnamed protein product [Didymodactylos carnosus]CAF1184777.1 unnamed protein product [Didymodactylos carnosus]CAF3727630.1 unnamed protein product [Didymodactylos carnosus]CAF3995967.1 unnamed protein product [Didymodactylos carnosus]